MLRCKLWIYVCLYLKGPLQIALIFVMDITHGACICCDLCSNLHCSLGCFFDLGNVQRFRTILPKNDQYSQVSLHNCNTDLSNFDDHWSFLHSLRVLPKYFRKDLPQILLNGRKRNGKNSCHMNLIDHNYDDNNGKILQ